MAISRQFPGYLCFFIFVAALSVPQAIQAGESRVIELTDGSVISGEVIEFDNGVYTIASESLGRLRLRDSEVRSIRSGTRSGQQSAPYPGKSLAPGSIQDFADIENRILGDPRIFSMVNALQQDPDVLAILHDQEIMRAIAAGDLQSLQTHPKILKLEGNSAIREIMGLVGQP